MDVRTIKTGFLCCLGEGPTWVPRLNSLFWVDIIGGAVHSIDLKTEAIRSWSVPGPVAWIVERANRDDFLVGLKSDIAEFHVNRGITQKLISLERDRPDNRLNDAKVDCTGTLWAGSKDDTDRTASGALYRLAPDLSVSRVDDGYGVTNGPTFSVDGKTMFHSDSAARTIYAFDIDANGSLSNRRCWLKFEDEWGYPDGMTTDADGCIWIAHWGGGKVSRFSPDAKIISQVSLPATNITSCAFGGANLDRLFVTSSTLGCEQQEKAGMLFEVSPGVCGFAPTPFAG